MFSAGRDFNPRSPDGERLNCNVVNPSRYVFQSTLPGWGATDISQHTIPFIKFQSTLPGWGATFMPVCAGICLIISIHAPRMGSDDIAEYRHYLTQIFQSTLPGWGATCPAFVITRRTLIFQSTLPGWGATRAFRPRIRCRIFQSTLPGWGATAKMDIFAHDMGKIIHFQH